jgi:aspartate/methionine/tyrosine aminotransferase
MPLREDNSYLIDFKSIPREIARTARLMLVSYPNNPTTAFAPDELYRQAQVRNEATLAQAAASIGERGLINAA